MGKQKMVLKLAVRDAKKRSKAMKMVVTLNGVSSASLEGEDKDKMVVVGRDGVDVVNVIRKLRKMMGSVDILSVAAVDDQYHQVPPEYHDDISEYSDNESCVPTCSLMLIIDCYIDHE